MIFDAEDKKLTFFNQSIPPRTGMTLITDSWWIKHPTKGLAVWRRSAPQCNTNKLITEKISKLYPWCEIEFVPQAHVWLDYGD